jgi:hypothetical protein
MRPKISHILKATLLAGTLDIIAALLYYYIMTGNSEVTTVFKFIAGGIFGKEALKGGASIIGAGLFFHYLIAFFFTVLFFLAFPLLKKILHNRLVTGIIYGLFVWTVMNLLVVPFSNIGSRPFDLVSALINMAILVICLGIPLAFIATHYFKKRQGELNP